MRQAAAIAIAKEGYFRFKFRYTPLQLFDDCGLICGRMPIPLQYGSQRGYRAGQRGHRFVVPAVGFRSLILAHTLCFRPLFLVHALDFRPLLLAHTLGFRPILSAVAATIPAIKVVGQQLRHSKDGQHNGDVRCALKVL